MENKKLTLEMTPDEWSEIYHLLVWCGNGGQYEEKCPVGQIDALHIAYKFRYEYLLGGN